METKPLRIARLLFGPAIAMLLLHPTIGFSNENRCRTYSTGDTTSLCRGKSLPSGRVRNKRDHRLTCTGNVDHYLRQPQNEVSYEKWSDLIKAGASQEAYDLKRKLPNIAWNGSIPYDTVEEWSYEECQLVTDALKCGTKEECQDEQVTVSDYDEEGNLVGSHLETKRVCYDLPKTCWADITYFETQYCSSETMAFSASFQRPAEAEWNPSTPGYNDFIPNKYDLLPAETEDVQIFNNTQRSTRLNPGVQIGSAWNKYEFGITGSGVNAACKQSATYSIDVVVRTIGRDIGKKTPNSFRLPVDWEGNALEPLLWKSAKDHKGTQIDRAIPNKLQLDDVAGAAVALMAEQSRRNAEREVEKAQIAAAKEAPSVRKEKSFWKNTRVRIKLYRIKKWWWDLFWSEQKIEEGESIAPSMNFLADDEQQRYSDFWVIPLADEDAYGGTRTNGLFDQNGTNRYLKPNRAYQIEISMYQPNMPFYLQSCDDAPDQSWRCNKFWRFMGFGYRENAYYSEPLKVKFRSPKDYEGRGWWRRSWLKNAPDNFSTWILGPVKLEGEK